jgi:transposase
MMALRRTFVENRKKIKVQMEHYSAKATIKQADREIKYLSERITQIEKEIFNLIDSEPELKQKFDILKTMPCIGKIVAATIVIECPELEESKPDEIYALAGVVPLNCDSGKMRGRRKIRGGRQIIRTVLFTSAMSAVHIVKEDNVLTHVTHLGKKLGENTHQKGFFV